MRLIRYSRCISYFQARTSYRWEDKEEEKQHFCVLRTTTEQTSRNFFPWFCFDVVSHAFTIWIAFSTFVQTDAISCYFFPFFFFFRLTRIPGSVSVLLVTASRLSFHRKDIRWTDRRNIIIGNGIIDTFDSKEKSCWRRVRERERDIYTHSYECTRIVARRGRRFSI